VPARPSGFPSRCLSARRRSWWAAGCDTCPGDTVRLVDSYRWCSACARNVKPARGRFDLLFSVTTIACFIALGELLGALIGPFPLASQIGGVLAIGTWLAVMLIWRPDRRLGLGARCPTCHSSNIGPTRQT
jgi:hypothetical protein